MEDNEHSRPRFLRRWPFAFWIGAASLAFLALLLVFGQRIACEQRGVFVAFVALAVALAFGFFGRSAELSGALPTILGGPSSLRLSLGGGVAVFALVMFYGGPTLFGRNWDDCRQPQVQPIVIEVRDQIDNAPISGAIVSIKIGVSTFPRVTDPFGEAEVTPEVDWKAQRASIGIKAEGYEHYNYNNTIPTTGRLELKLMRTHSPTVPPESHSVGPPERLVVLLDGKASQSIATWAGGTLSRSWDCITVPVGFDLVIVRDHHVNLGKRRGQCVGPGPYCDSTSEYCIDVIVDRGCLVNKAWHAWYKAAARKMGTPYSKSTVCEDDDPSNADGASGRAALDSVDGVASTPSKDKPQPGSPTLVKTPPSNIHLGDLFRICRSNTNSCLGMETSRITVDQQRDTKAMSRGFAFALGDDQPVFVQYLERICIRGQQGDPYWNIQGNKVMGGNITGHAEDDAWQFQLQSVSGKDGLLSLGDEVRILDATGMRGLKIIGADLLAVPAAQATHFRLMKR